MKMRRIAAVALAIGLVAGCSDGNEENDTPEAVEPSAECVELFRQAAATNDEDVYGPLFDESLVACETVDQWLAGLKEHPGAIGLKGPQYVDDISVQGACGTDDFDTPVCSEAVDTGRIPAP